MNDMEILNFAYENGMIDIGTIQHEIIMNERKRYIQSHKWKIWQGSNGKWYTYVPDSVSGKRLIKRSTRESLDDAIIDFYKRVDDEPYLKDIFYGWLNSKLEYGEILKQTYDRYETDYNRFFLDTDISKMKFSSISENVLEDYIKRTIRERKLTAKAWGNLRTIIQGMFKYAKKHGYTQISITQFMGDLDISNKVFTKRFFSDEESVFTDLEIQKITDYISGKEVSLINLGILLAFQTGLRAGELSALKYSDVQGNVLSVMRTEIRYKDPDTGAYIFDVRESTKGKDGSRKVILTDYALDIIRKIRKSNPFGEYLFMRNGTRIKEKAFTVKLYRICDNLNIQRRSLHKARKTYATKLINAGLDDKLIEKQMGHTDIRTTKGYYYYNNREFAEIKELLDLAIK